MSPSRADSSARAAAAAAGAATLGEAADEGDAGECGGAVACPSPSPSDWQIREDNESPNSMRKGRTRLHV